MAARTTQANDGTTLLHAGQVTVSAAGFTDPAGNPWILMDDTVNAKNGLYVRNNSSGNAVVVGVGGAGADTNPSLSIYAGNASNASTGTGTLTMGSSAGTVSFGGTITGLVTSSAVTVEATASNSSGGSSVFPALLVGNSSGTSSFQGWGVYYGSSVPTLSAQFGSLYVMTSSVGSAGTVSSANARIWINTSSALVGTAWTAILTNS